MAHITNTVANSAAAVLCVTTSCLCCNSISIAVYSTNWHKEKIATRKVVECSWVFDVIFTLTSVTNATSNILLIIAIYCGEEAYVAKKTKFWNVKNVLRLFIVWNGLTALVNYAASLTEAAVLDIRLRSNGAVTKEATAVPGDDGPITDRQSSVFDNGTSDADITVPATSGRTGHNHGTRLLGYLIVFYTVVLLVKICVLYCVYYKFLRLLLEDKLVAAGCSYSDTASTVSQELERVPWNVKLIQHSRRACEAERRDPDGPVPHTPPEVRFEQQHPAVDEPSRALEEWVEASTSRKGSITDQALPMNVVPNRNMPRTAIWAEADLSPSEDQRSSSLEALQQKSFLRRPRRASVAHNHHAVSQHGIQLHGIEHAQPQAKTVAAKQADADAPQHQPDTPHV